MSGLVESVNSELRRLDDAHRLGQISRDAYRSQRRQLFASLAGGDGTTVPRPLPTPAAAPSNSAGDSVAVPASPAGHRKWVGIGLACITVLCAGAIGVWMLPPASAPAVGATIAAQPAALSSDDERQAMALDALAGAVITDGHWTAEPLNDFLRAWTAASGGVRTRAMALPSVALLHEQIGPKRKVADLLVDGDSSGPMSAQDAQALHAVDDALKVGP